jgi:hypothetical protein
VSARIFGGVAAAQWNAFATSAILEQKLVTLRNVLPLVALGLAGISAAHGQDSAADPVFASVPFDQWLAESEPPHFRWALHVGGAELNSHQRLQARVEIQIDGNELVSRRGHGQLVILIQFQDSADRVYRTHGALDLQDVKDDAGKSNIQYIQDAFLLPGDYRVGVAIFDEKTREHNAAQKPLHVNPLRNDPLPSAWKGLPAVELLHSVDAPDSWFLPYLSGHLQLPVATRRPIRVELLMNASPTGPSRGLSVGTVNNRNLANMVPALKVFSEMDVAGGSLHITLLDIPKRRAIFEQDPVRQLDWARLRVALTQADPNKIDVRSLEHREQNAQYFLDQVRQRLGAKSAAEQAPDEPFRVLIVLTAPMTLDSGEHPHPIELDGKPNGKVYYVRYHLPLERMPIAPVYEPMSRMGRRNNPSILQPQSPAEAFDSLAPLLKPLQPRLFEVYSPEQFRKTLSSIIEEIARL